MSYKKESVEDEFKNCRIIYSLHLCDSRNDHECKVFKKYADVVRSYTRLGKSYF